MVKKWILPYKYGSRSAKALATAFGIKRAKAPGLVPSPGDYVINWGKPPSNWIGMHYLNDGSAVAVAGNKLKAFQAMEGKVPIPPFWVDKEEIPDEAFPIVCRTILTGHSGAGIVLAASRDSLVDCSLYVKYLKKKDEYRVHCSKDAAFSWQRKARRLSTPDDEVNWQVRNLAGGFVFVREGSPPPAAAVDGAVAAINALKLDFGAVDVIWNEHDKLAHVLEVNTAPGLEGQTITDYKNYFEGVFNGYGI